GRARWRGRSEHQRITRDHAPRRRREHALVDRKLLDAAAIRVHDVERLLPRGGVEHLAGVARHVYGADAGSKASDAQRLDAAFLIRGVRAVGRGSGMDEVDLLGVAWNKRRDVCALPAVQRETAYACGRDVAGEIRKLPQRAIRTDE